MLVSHKIVNQNEICVCSMRRNGQHAIINWIASQAKGKVCFLNNVTPYLNPFICHNPNLLEEYQKEYDIRKEAQGEWRDKDYLIYNYEDFGVSVLDGIDNEKFVGKSASRKKVLILRDPYNSFASRLRWFRKGFWIDILSFDSVYKWITYAQKFLEDSPDVIGINYNLWVLEETYRKQIAQRLELEFTDEGYNSKIGASTFGDSDFFNRWKVFERDPEFVVALANPEIRRLSKDIFGWATNF